MQLKTDRLVLRPFSEADGSEFFAIQSDPEIQKFLHGTSDEQESLDHLHEFIEALRRDGHGLLALTLVETDELIGYGGFLRSDVGSGEELQVLVGVLPNWRKQGFAAEALAALLRWAHIDLSQRRVLAVARADNKASLSLLSKAGATLVGERPYKWPYEPVELVYEFVSPVHDA